MGRWPGLTVGGLLSRDCSRVRPVVVLEGITCVCVMIAKSDVFDEMQSTCLVGALIQQSEGSGYKLVSALSLCQSRSKRQIDQRESWEKKRRRS